MLSQEQIAFYHENGYLTVENVLSADELDALQRVTDEFIDRSRLVSEHNDVFDLEPDHSPRQPSIAPHQRSLSISTRCMTKRYATMASWTLLSS